MGRLGDNQVLAEWVGSDRGLALATLIEVLGSAPLDQGSMMAVTGDGLIEGSVTGGCVEGALAQTATRMLNDGGGAEVHTFGISDDVAAGVGLMCGGTVRILLDAPRPEDRALIAEVMQEAAAGRETALATVIDGERAGARMALIGDRIEGSLGLDLLDRNVETAMRGMLANGESGLRRFGPDGATIGDEVRVFIHAHALPPNMVIFGAIDFSVATARLAREVGFAVTIVEARPAFAASSRFTDVADVEVSWPDSYMDGRQLGHRDVVLVFTHDPKFDEPALLSALASDAGYIGALGSRRTQEQRRKRLLELGASPADIERIAAPCGLDIGARTPQETAISILAEVIAMRNQRPGMSLSAAEGPIHSR